MKKSLPANIILLLLLFDFLFSDPLYEVPVRNIQFSLTRVDGYDRIKVSGSFIPCDPGYPELPAIAYNYLLPQGEKLKSVHILEEKWEEINGNFHIYPKQKEIVVFEDRQFTHPDPDVYSQDGPCTENIIVSLSSGNLRGYQIGQVGILPFKYFPKKGKLFVLKQLTIGLTTENNETGVFPKRQTRIAKHIVEKLLSDIVVNKTSVDHPGVCPPVYTEVNMEDLEVTDLPSIIGAPVDLLIITTDSQLEGYKDFSRTKKILGYNSVVKTLSWIRQHYNGFDDAARIRNFIDDAVVNWGVIYVLLGGDIPQLPARWIWMPPLYNQWSVHIVTDLYYSDLDGNWNFNGNEKFGEVADSLDLYPDVFVGRLPTRDAREIHGYISKISSYLQPPNTDIQTKALFFTSNFDVPNDAYQMALRLSNHLPSWFSTTFIDEQPLQSLKDSIYSGFGLIAGLGHGDINNIRVRNSPRQNATNFFFDSLANTDQYAMMFVITCYTNSFQSDCLSKHWVLNPHGGGIGYIGPTSFSEGYLHEEYTAEQFDSLFSYPLSVVLAKSKVPFISNAQWDNWYRLYQFSITLIGDPTVTLWDSIPLTYNSVTVTPDTLSVGSDTITINVEPSVPFEVVLYKEGELFIRDSTSTGTGVLRRLVKIESPGYLKYTVMARHYIALTDSILVEPEGPYLAYSDHIIVDTAHNANQIINPGEDIYLYIILENNGGSTASGVDAQISCSDSLLTMYPDTVSFPDIDAGGIAKSNAPFYFEVSDNMPDEHSFDFDIQINYSGLASSDSFQIIGTAPVLVHFTQVFDSHDDSVSILPYLINYGHSYADSVYGRISASSDTVVIIDSLVNFPLIPANSIVSSEPDSFRVFINYSGSKVRFNLKIYNKNLEVVNADVILNTPVAPDSLRALGKKSSIALEWSQVTSAIGYHIYRAPSLNAPFTLLNKDVDAVCCFEDNTAQSGVEYYYYVVAVDSSKNHGVPSDTVCGKTNPMLAQGWPQTVYDYLFSSPNFGDIDPFYPGLEIVVCGKDGNIYAWHCDGSPLLDDSRIFNIYPAEVWTSPALGDVNRDGLLEIVFGVRRSTDNLYLINYRGRCLPGWPKSIPGRLIGSPVLADIDEDGDLEIFVWTLYSDIYAFHHDGSGVYSADGLLKELPGIAFGTLAIGDINNDGHLEIVCCGGSASDSLFVWDMFGNYLSRFPVFVQTGSLPYSVVLGDVLGDARLEICFYADSSESVYLVDSDGNIQWSVDLNQVADVEGSPIIADLDGDNHPEIICGYQSGFTVFDSLGNALSGFPDITHDAKLGVVADINNDTTDLEAVVGSIDWNLYAYTSSGKNTAGFPIQFSNRLEASPAIYDIDLDGKLELMVGGNDYKFYVFDLETNLVDWPKFRYDQYNSGMYRSENLQGVITNVRSKSIDFGLSLCPNPFIKTLKIYYSFGYDVFHGRTGVKSGVEDPTLKIYDVTGRLIKSFSNLANEPSNRIIWLGDDDYGRKVASGVYFVRFETDIENTTEKIIKIK